MNTSPFKENPDLYVFIPVLYITWSDTVLSQQEADALNSLIKKQTWLDASDKQVVVHLLNPSSPPTPDQYKEWLSDIRMVFNGNKPKDVRLSDISIKLAQLKGGGKFNNSLDEVKGSLDDIENALGLIGSETLYDSVN